MRNILFCALVFIIGCNGLQQKTSTDEKNKDTIHPVTSRTAVKDSFSNLNEALLNPDKAVTLYLSYGLDSTVGYIKHLPAKIGTLAHLKLLNIECMQSLEDLPSEIGNLKSLEELTIENGNGCSMNVNIPASIGQLTNLKTLTLDGALDYRDGGNNNDTTKIKKLPSTIKDLQNLEELNLERNGLLTIPPQVWSLKKLKILRLSFNEIKEISSDLLNLTNLKELDISCNYDIKLPQCLKEMKGLKVYLNTYNQMASTKQEEHIEQEKEDEVRKRFPNIIFSFGDCD